MTRAVQVDGWRVWLDAATGATSPARERATPPAGSRPRGDAEPGGSRDEARAWVAVVATIEGARTPLHRSKHAATYRVGVGGRDVYVKVYRRYRLATAVKDLARRSKARHVAAVSADLAADGFRVPRVLAAGEERRGPWVRRSWLVTAALDGTPLAELLAALARESLHAGRATLAAALRAKRALLGDLGTEIARLHARGFVAGDLVPSNVWVVAGEAPSRQTVDACRAPSGRSVAALAFLDHDRTRLVRAAAPWWRARRNLVQLNRVVLGGVVLTDRLRVYRAYAAARGFPRAQARRRLDWIVAKTIERRRRFDHVVLDGKTPVSFRELMRAGGRFAPRDDGHEGSERVSP